MGHIERVASKPSWNTFIEAETKTCIQEKINMHEVISGLELHDLEAVGETTSSQTLRHVIFSQKDAEIEKYGSDHVTVILSKNNPNYGLVRPKRKLLYNLDMNQRYPEPEHQNPESQYGRTPYSVEYELIPFESRESKALAAKSGLYKVGVKKPDKYISSQPFIKLREKRLYRHQNGLALEVSGDTIVTKTQTLQRIEIEIAPPFFPNSVYCEQLNSTTQALREQLSRQGLTIYEGRSNSSLMKQLLTGKSEVSKDDIKYVLELAEKEKRTQNKAHNKSLAA